MPLIAFGAGVVRGQRDELVGLVDVLPTLLELAGGPVDGFDGRSLVPALEGRALGGEVPWRDQIATTQDGHRVEPTIPVRAVRFEVKYIRTWGRGCASRTTSCAPRHRAP